MQERKEDEGQHDVRPHRNGVIEKGIDPGRGHGEPQELLRHILAPDEYAHQIEGQEHQCAARHGPDIGAVFVFVEQSRAKAQQAVGQEIVEQNACPVDGDPMAHDVVQASVGEPGEKPPARTVPRGEEHQRQYGDGPAVGQAVEPEHPQDDRQRHHDAALAEGSRAFLGQFVHVHCVLPP